MSKLTLLCVILVLITASTVVKAAGQVTRIERNIKSLDLKLNAHSIDISTLKNDVVDANNKLDLILQILNDTTSGHKTYRDTASDSIKNRDTSDQVTTLNDLKVTIQKELNRVRQAFVAEKKKLSQQQKQNNAEFHELVQRMNDTLANLKHRHDTNCSLAVSAMNESVVSVLGTMRDDIRDQVSVWNKSIHEHLNENANNMLSKLNVVDRSIGSLNLSIHESNKESNLATMASIHASAITHDGVIQKLQNDITSSLNKLHATVEDTTCTNDCSDVTSIQAQGREIENLLRQIISKSETINERVPYRTHPFSRNPERRPALHPRHPPPPRERFRD